MHKQWEDLLPFYLNRTLSPNEVYALEQHLARCAACRQALEEWRMVADAAYHTANDWSKKLPPLKLPLKTGEVVTSPTQQAVYSVKRTTRASYRITMTLAAVLTLFVVGGALIVFFAIKETPEQQASEVAGRGTEVTLTAFPSEELSPTPEPSATRTPVVFITATDEPADTPAWETLIPPTATATIMPTNTMTYTATLQPTNTVFVQPTEYMAPTTVIIPTQQPGMDEPGINVPSVDSENASPDLRSMQTGSVEGDCYAHNASLGSISLYTAPEINAQAVDILMPSEELRIVRLNYLSGWYRVFKRDQYLWVHRDVVATRGGCGWLDGTSPTDPTAPIIPTTSASQTLILTSFNVTPETVTPGTLVVLEWRVENAQRVRIVADLSDIDADLDLDFLPAEGATSVIIPANSHSQISFVLWAYDSNPTNNVPDIGEYDLRDVRVITVQK